RMTPARDFRRKQKNMRKFRGKPRASKTTSQSVEPIKRPGSLTEPHHTLMEPSRGNVLGRGLRWFQKHGEETDMNTRNTGPMTAATRHSKQLTLAAVFDALRGLFALQRGGMVQHICRTARSVLWHMSSIDRNQYVLDELNRMSDYELADIGLIRSDLSVEGLAIGGAKRALKQEAVAREIGLMHEEWEAVDHEAQY
ncbi:MAG: DUF1127 domain-containing protein, partial [Pseudomonadota bacterium]